MRHRCRTAMLTQVNIGRLRQTFVANTRPTIGSSERWRSSQRGDGAPWMIIGSGTMVQVVGPPRTPRPRSVVFSLDGEHEVGLSLAPLPAVPACPTFAVSGVQRPAPIGKHPLRSGAADSSGSTHGRA